MSEVTKYEPQGQLTEAEPLSIKQIVGQVQLIQQVMREVMKEGEHYGKIPGCGDKPALLKAGAEKLGMTFRLAPRFEIKQSEHDNSHREYQVTCTLNDRYQGVGSCSTLEGKYRFRTGPKKSTGKPVPKQYWDLRQSNPAQAQALLGGKGFATAKEDGVWMICEQGEKVEHDNPADHYNTVLKMAKKRAHVDAILTATAASDIFTQDIEEIVENQAVATGQAPKTSQDAPAAAKTSTGQEKSSPPHASEQEQARFEDLPANKPATSAEVLPPKEATDATKKWFLDQIAAAAITDIALEYFRKKDQLLPTEDLLDLPLKFVPISKEAARKVIVEIQGLIPTGGEDEAWCSFPMPYGKNAGIPLSDLDKKYLYGLWANYTVETEYNGRAKKPEQIEKDTLFREMLDDAGVHYDFKKD
jgi:hypothetical protein